MSHWKGPNYGITICGLAIITSGILAVACTRLAQNSDSANNGRDEEVRKQLTSNLEFDTSEPLQLTGDEDVPLTVVSATGHVDGCIDSDVELRVAGNTLSIEVAESCTATTISVAEVRVSAAGFIGRVGLRQGQATLINDSVGRWMLSELTVRRLSRNFEQTAVIRRGTGTVTAQFNIDGSIECGSVSARALSSSQVQFDMVGSFPLTALGSSAGALAFSSVSGNHGVNTASWIFTVPAGPADGVINSEVSLSWSESQELQKSCSLAAAVTIQSVASINAAVSTACNLNSAELCPGISPDYCHFPILVGLEIPSLCPVGSCLFVRTEAVSELGSDPLVVQADCI